MSIWNPFQKDRDLQQIEQLYRQYREPLWRYAYKLLHDEHLAQDVVQSVFIKAIEKSQLISSLDCNKAKAYFVIMVRNLSYTLYRQQKRHPAIPFEGGWKSCLPTPTTTRSRRSSAAVSRSRSIRRSNSCMNPTAMCCR